MSLLAALRGMANGPTGQSNPNASGGMSPLTMALLGYLVYKGIKHMSGTQTQTSSAEGGGLGDLLSGGLGGLLSGGLGSLLNSGNAGSALSTGLGSLLRQFEENGQSEQANSWVGTGPNKDISEKDLAKSLGEEDINSLSQQTGMSRDDLLTALRRELPNLVDQLTPQGRVPAPHEVSSSA